MSQFRDWCRQSEGHLDSFDDYDVCVFGDGQIGLHGAPRGDGPVTAVFETREHEEYVVATQTIPFSYGEFPATETTHRGEPSFEENRIVFSDSEIGVGSGVADS